MTPPNPPKVQKLGTHECWDWDGLKISPGDPEWAGCLCEKETYVTEQKVQRMTEEEIRLYQDRLNIGLHIDDAMIRKTLNALEASYHCLDDIAVENCKLLEATEQKDAEIERFKRLLHLEELSKLAFKERNKSLESLLSQAVEVAKAFSSRECLEEYDWPTEEQEMARSFLSSYQKHQEESVRRGGEG